MAVSAVAFLVPAPNQHQHLQQRRLSCFTPTHISTHSSSSRSSTSTFFGGIQIAPPHSPAAAAAASAAAAAARSTRYRRSSSSSTLFAAAVSSSENDKEEGGGDVLTDALQQEEVIFGREKTSAAAVTGRSSTGRTSEQGRPRRWQRSRSVVRAGRKTFGRLFRRGYHVGLSTEKHEEELKDDDARFNSVVAEQAEQVRCYEI